MPVVTPPPAAKKTTRTFSSPKSKNAERLEGLQGWGQLGQAGLIAFRRYADAGAVGMHVPGIAAEIANLADTNENIASGIDSLIAAGPYTALIMATLPLVVQLGVNWGFVSPGAMGSVSRETVAARVEAGIARMQAQAYREQQEAEQETERLREEIRQARSTIPASAVA
jgi:hypothetical protein